MGLSVNLLGGFTAAVDGVTVPNTAWRLKKARELVKLLAPARDHRLHREQAMDVLWRDLAPAAAANNLNQAVHVARRALGPDAIDVQEEVLSLAADVDVDLLERLAADARRMRTAASYGVALSLYRGELLPENRYDDWAAARRDELAALAANLTEEAVALGDSARSGLPAETSSFVARTRELGELEALLQRTRLLTLTGTGGVGKTRLALELARAAQPSYESGAALVELASVGDARLVTEAVASALDGCAASRTPRSLQHPPPNPTTASAPSPSRPPSANSCGKPAAPPPQPPPSSPPRPAASSTPPIHARES